MTINLNILLSILNNLNGIEVKGKTNMNKLLASIMALEQIVEEAQKAAAGADDGETTTELSEA